MDQQYKRCSKCRIIKELKEFYRDNSRKDKSTYQCRSCMTEYRKRNLSKMRDYMRRRMREDPEYICETSRRSYRNKDISEKLYTQARKRARIKGITFNIIKDDIKVPNYCPYLNVKLEPGTKGDYENTHSIDRINNNLGYIPGNIEVISKKANSMKNSATPVELVGFAKEILRRFEDNNIVQSYEKS